MRPYFTDLKNPSALYFGPKEDILNVFRVRNILHFFFFFVKTESVGASLRGSTNVICKVQSAKIRHASIRDSST